MREVPLYLHHMITTQVPSTRAFALERQTRSERINAFCAVLSTEGRVVGPCWEILKPEGPKVVPPLTSCVSLPLTQTHTISHLLSLSPTLALLLSLSLSRSSWYGPNTKRFRQFRTCFLDKARPSPDFCIYSMHPSPAERHRKIQRRSRKPY